MVFWDVERKRVNSDHIILKNNLWVILKLIIIDNIINFFERKKRERDLEFWMGLI